MGQMYLERSVAGSRGESHEQSHKENAHEGEKARVHLAHHGLVIWSGDQGLVIQGLVIQGLVICSGDTEFLLTDQRTACRTNCSAPAQVPDSAGASSRPRVRASGGKGDGPGPLAGYIAESTGSIL
jgi:hypothetical protein